MTVLIGTDKQITWAHTIIKKKQIEFDLYGLQLPDVRDAKFWIDNREVGPDDIIDRAASLKANRNAVSTPFTAHYSRYGREDVRIALSSLQDCVTLDTETTGLERDKNAEIVELAIVEQDTGFILFNSLIQPGDLSKYGEGKSASAQKVHGITREELAEAPKLADVWEEIHSILTTHPILVYNAEFDAKMIRRSAKKYNLPTPRLYSTCVMKMFSAFMESDDLYKLSEACNILGVDLSSYGYAHRALADTLATTALVNKMRALLPPGTSMLPIEHLISIEVYQKHIEECDNCYWGFFEDGEEYLWKCGEADRLYSIVSMWNMRSLPASIQVQLRGIPT